MRKAGSFAIVFLACFLPAANHCRADMNVGLSIGDEGIKRFYLAIGEQYQLPEKEVVVVRQRNIPDEELPVVFFLARQSKAAPDIIVQLRLGGKSWMEITAHFGLGADIFYVPLAHPVSRSPYGKAYGHYKDKRHGEWKTIHLADADIVNLVNLRFMSARHGCPPDEIVRMREHGQTFVQINSDMLKGKGQAKDKDDDKSSDRNDGDRDKTKDKEKDKEKGKGKGK